MKKSGFNNVGVVILVLAMVLISAPAQAAMWVGVELGPSFAANTDFRKSEGGEPNETIYGMYSRPSVMGGITAGYDFINQGFLGYDWPDWAKYFGVAVDFSYQKLYFPQQTRTVREGAVSAVENIHNFKCTLPTLSFLFIAKYGFLPDAEVPFGRIVPYVAVGPALVMASMQTSEHGTERTSNIALAVESGIRFMATQNISLTAAFRYRYTQLNFLLGESFRPNESVKFDANLFNVIFRVAYHF
jgi:opacity protein-like surface antigen